MRKKINGARQKEDRVSPGHSICIDASKMHRGSIPLCTCFTAYFSFTCNCGCIFDAQETRHHVTCELDSTSSQIRVEPTVHGKRWQHAKQYGVYPVLHLRYTVHLRCKLRRNGGADYGASPLRECYAPKAKRYGVGPVR